MLGVSGKSVSGRVADHNNFVMLKSPLGSTTQRDLRPVGGGPDLQRHGLLNTGRTGSLILMTGSIGQRKVIPETNLTSRLSDEHTPRQAVETQLRKRIKLDKAKSTNLKSHIRQGEANKDKNTIES